MPTPRNLELPRGTISGSVSNGLLKYTIRAVPLPGQITDYLDKASDVIRNIAPRHRSNQGRLILSHKASSEQAAQRNLDDPSQSSPEEVDHNDLILDPTAPPTASSVPEGAAFWFGLNELNAKHMNKDLEDIVDKLWAFGPRRIGPNVLLDRFSGSTRL